MTETLSYHARLNVLENERVYRLAPEALVIDYLDGAQPEAVRFEEISQVRLRYSPTRSQWDRFECVLTVPARGEFKIGSQFYKGVMAFENRAGEYGAFVRELCRRLAERAPGTRFVSGRPKWALLAESAFLLSMVALLVVVLVAIGGVLGAFPLMRLGLAAVSLPLLWLYYRRNRPRTFDPRDVPAELLPKA
jgi:hypothetical protein